MAEPTQDIAEEYVLSKLEENISTREIVAALKFRFNVCGKKDWKFAGLAKLSKQSKPHKAIPRSDLESLME
jgi:hypothetical protein